MLLLKMNGMWVLSFAITGIYILGALTGGNLFSVIKKITRLDKKND